ncbi:(+)-borneol dehydrogenase 1 [Linum grandiflorum]
MIPEKRGSIVFTASYVTASFGDAGHAYTASKQAVVGLMKNLSVELGAHGIRVNSVSPFATGVTDPKIITDGVTARVGLGGAILEADDLAEAALYLASEESKFVSGLNLLVDGGFHLRSS